MRLKNICDVMHLVRGANEACRGKKKKGKKNSPKTRKVRQELEQEACYRGRRERRNGIGVDWGGLGLGG